MKIITISREFGSGGRELGKRLADFMGYDYYDSEIIAAVAQKSGMDEKYVENTLSNHGWQNHTITFRGTLGSSAYMQASKINLLLEQKKVIEEIAAMGKDCIIVGRNADMILKEYHPFNIFVSLDKKQSAFFSHYDPNMVEWFGKMVEERKKQHDCSKERKNW